MDSKKGERGREEGDRKESGHLFSLLPTESLNSHTSERERERESVCV